MLAHSGSGVYRVVPPTKNHLSMLLGLSFAVAMIIRKPGKPRNIPNGPESPHKSIIIICVINVQNAGGGSAPWFDCNKTGIHR